jgi:shikimate kinase
LGFGFIDLDEYIEQREKMGVNQIFQDKGESYFRDVEKQAINSLVGIRSHVIATGGGAVIDDDNWHTLCDMGATVWLCTTAQEIARRLVGNEVELKKRPLLAELVDEADPLVRQKALAERLSALIGQRQERYKQADLILEDAFSTAESTAKQFVFTLRAEGWVKQPADDGPLDRWGTL